jgi:transposase
MTRNKKDGNYQIEMIDINDLIPEDHVLRIIEKEFDFNFIYEYVADLYSPLGPPSIDPVVLFKCHFIKVYYGLSSLRRTYDEIKYNFLYKWFLGYGMSEKTPNYSTYSQNYKRKYHKLEEDLLETFFYKVLTLLDEKGILDLSEIFKDSTHTKANANKKKVTKELVEIIASEYREELEKEIVKVKSEIKGEEISDEINVENDIECNHELKYERVVETKEITKSIIDPDAGILYKDEKEKMVAYNTTVIGDKNNYVVAYDVNPSNMHDSKAFYPAYKKFKDRFGTERTNYEALDAAYITPHICKTLIEDGIIPCMPYKRPMTKKDYFKKYEYIYDEYNDIYICPNECDLIPVRVDKNGYIHYRADKKECEKCSFKSKCTKNAPRVILRHVWEKYREMAVDEYRHDLDVKEVYTSRSEHIERIFADAKQQHGLRYTLFRGKRRVSSEIGLLFAAMNLKKYALHIQRQGNISQNPVDLTLNSSILEKLLLKTKNVFRNLFFRIHLSTV